MTDFAAEMAAQGKRSGKFRHIYGDVHKLTFKELKNPLTSGEGTYLTANSKFIAISRNSGGGPCYILNIDKPGRIPVSGPTLSVQKGKVCDMDFHPFISNMIATVSEDCSVAVTSFPSEGLTENVLKPDVLMKGHGKKVVLCQFNKSAKSILASASFDKTVKLWNIEEQSEIMSYGDAKDNIYSLEWNNDGSLLAVTSKDKNLHIFDPRKKEEASKTASFGGTKASKCFWMHNLGWIGATGFSKAAKRQLNMWDLRDLTKPIKAETLDAAASVLMPYYDNELGLLFMFGKGDGVVQFSEVINDSRKWYQLGSYRSNEPQKGGGWMAKRACDVWKAEVNRFFKLTTKSVVPISFIVPRKSAADVFQEDIYPPTYAGKVALSADEWLSGKNKEPVTRSMNPSESKDDEKDEVFVAKKSYKDLEADNAAKKKQVKELNARVAELEAKIAAAKGGDIPTETETEVEEKKEDRAPAVVIRREIRSMSDSEQNRFFDAIDTMFKAESGPGTSEFFRCASIHGQPAPIYCEHGRETFPGWHRIYLMDFEQALQTADKQNGNDGNISLPYWDWTVKPEEGLPEIIRKRFQDWPDDFWPKAMQGQSRTKKLIRNSDSGIAAQLKSWGVTKSAKDCLLATQHFIHASTRFAGTYPSIETSHNSIHVIAGGNGGQMGAVAWASFDIVFWLHHCMVDRIYESYLILEPDSAQEFENFQDSRSKDMFDRPFEPFRKPNGDSYGPKDTFDTEALGYKFDTLWPVPPQQLREPPTYIFFSQVKVFEFESKCYQIHCFVVDKDEENEFKAPATVDEIDYDSPNYAGGAGIFGRGMECQNCVNRPPQDIAIDVTRALRELGINRYKAKAVCLVLETTEDSNALIAVEDTPLAASGPVITGPLFVNKDGGELLDQDDKKTNDEAEVAALQRYLQKYGYYAPDKAIDGDYGDATRQAVADYQAATGVLKVDGVAGPKTRNSIINNKRCDNIDPFAKNDVADPEVDYAQTSYTNENPIKYFVGTQPGYLARDRVELCIAKACGEYDKNTSLKFEVVSEEKDCDIKFVWKMFAREDDPLRFDKAGGVLGRAGNGYVEFDMAERWVIGLGDDDKELLSDLFDAKTWYRGQPTISLYYTALHELGHALGLVHSSTANNVMSPWYNPKQMALSQEDIANIQAIVD